MLRNVAFAGDAKKCKVGGTAHANAATTGLNADWDVARPTDS
jgi:hypothetical protein